MALTPQEKLEVEKAAAAAGLTPLEYLDKQIADAEAEIAGLEAELDKIDTEDTAARADAQKEMDQFIAGVTDPKVAEELRQATEDWLDPKS